MAINEDKLNAFMGRFVDDLGAVMHAATIVVGDQLGLYKKLAEGPADVETLARRTETDARYLREWLSAQAASGYVDYDPETQRFSASAKSRPSRWRRKAARPSFRARSRSRWSSSRPSPRWSRPCAPVWAWAGTSTTPRCSTAPSASSGPGYAANLVSQLDSGARRRRRAAQGRRQAWPTSAAATAPRRS